jgi:EAL domain-containing protein (putative c-di-GMP-specific phosphodiesterase class I)
VIKQSAWQVAQWIAICPNLQISCNLESYEFQNPLLSANINKAIEKNKIPYSAIKLEILESLPMGDGLNIILDLLKHGTHFAIDDVGVGYGNLGRVLELSELVDLVSRHQLTLKIDKNYIPSESLERGQVCKTLIYLAKDLGMRACAEGVETLEQLKLLQLLGCHSAQGYFFKKPIRAEEVTKLLNS